MTVIIEQVALNKSNLLLKIVSQNTQTLQPLTKMDKVEIMYKSYLKDKLEDFGSETLWSNSK
jgi:hypothetical protein